MHKGAPRSPAPSRQGPDLLREATDAIERIGDSSGSTSDLGNDPSAPPVLEVLELWGGNLMNAGHFDARSARVLVGDPTFGRLRLWSTGLTLALVLGVGLLMVRHGTLPDPPRYVGEDEALIAGWTADLEAERQARARAATDQRQAERGALEAEAARLGVSVGELEPVVAPEPEDPLFAWKTAWDEARRAEFERLQERFPDENWHLRGVPGFELAFLPNHERLLREEIVPLARAQAREGRLRRSWVEVFEDFDAEYPLEEDEAQAIEACLFAWGSQVIHEGEVRVVVPAPGRDLADIDGQVRVAVPGSHRRMVHLADAGGELISVDPDTILADRLPTPQERADRRGLHDELQRLLYLDATARRSTSQQCRAVANLVVLPGAEVDFELQARQARCLHQRGLRDESRPYLERATELLPARPDGDAEAEMIAALLQVRAEQLALAAEQDEDQVAEATAAWQEVRGFLIDELRDPGLLAVADHGIHRLGLAELASRQERLVKRAIQLALAVGLLLPVGLLVDERRSRRGGPDFAVPGWDLPADPFPLVEVEDGQVRVCFGRDQVGTLVDGDGAERTTAELADLPATEDLGGWLAAPLGGGERFLLQVGERVFSVRRVDAARAVVAPMTDGLDWRFAGTLAAVLLLGGSLAVLSVVLPSGTSTEILIWPDSGTISLAAPVMFDDLPEMSGSDEGERAAGEEGRRGDPEAAADVPEARIAMRKRERDEELVDGLINELFVMDGYAELATDGLGDTIIGAMSELGVGPRGMHLGPGGGRGVRGRGPGGGGNSRFSGIGIKDLGTGRRGREGPDAFTTVRRPNNAGPMNSEGAIFLSGIDKSAVDRVVKSHLASIRYCYQRELPGNPDLSGKVVVKFVIAKDGTVSQSTIRSSTLRNQPAERCLVERFSRMRFVKPKGGGIAVVSYPLVFSSAGG